MGIKDKVRAFYERHPYPSQHIKASKDLEKGHHARIMETILGTMGLEPKMLCGMRVLDAGCGTGEKAAYCALYGAKVDAFDISSVSIRIAKQNAKKLGLKVNYFVDSFEQAKLKQEYDLVLCIGTLHHTQDPHMNFSRMARLVKKGGLIGLGLYNLYGRLGFRLRRKLLWLGEKHPERIMEKIGLKGKAGMEKKEADKERAHEKRMAKSAQKQALLADRFASPHETYHSVEEVRGWFGKEGIMPIQTHPKVNLGSMLDPKIKQLSWLVKNRGFFFIGGKKSA